MFIGTRTLHDQDLYNDISSRSCKGVLVSHRWRLLVTLLYFPIVFHLTSDMNPRVALIDKRAEAGRRCAKELMSLSIP